MSLADTIRQRKAFLKGSTENFAQWKIYMEHGAKKYINSHHNLHHDLEQHSDQKMCGNDE